MAKQTKTETEEKMTEEVTVAAPVTPASPSAEQQQIAILQGTLAEQQATITKLVEQKADLLDKVSRLEKDNENLREALERKLKASPTGDHVVFKGETFPIVGDYRADNTFHHVKTRDCDEGITLIAIPRMH